MSDPKRVGFVLGIIFTLLAEAAAALFIALPPKTTGSAATDAACGLGVAFLVLLAAAVFAVGGTSDSKGHDK